MLGIKPGLNTFKANALPAPRCYCSSLQPFILWQQNLVHPTRGQDWQGAQAPPRFISYGNILPWAYPSVAKSGKSFQRLPERQEKSKELTSGSPILGTSGVALTEAGTGSVLRAPVFVLGVPGGRVVSGAGLGSVSVFTVFFS